MCCMMKAQDDAEGKAGKEKRIAFLDKIRVANF